MSQIASSVPLGDGHAVAIRHLGGMEYSVVYKAGDDEFTCCVLDSTSSACCWVDDTMTVTPDEPCFLRDPEDEAMVPTFRSTTLPGWGLALLTCSMSPSQSVFLRKFDGEWRSFKLGTHASLGRELDEERLEELGVTKGK